jgi:hypothetical protein
VAKIPKSLKRTAQIIGNPRGILYKTYSHSRDLLKLQSAIRDFVPSNVFVASMSNETLHLITSSSAAATQIRYRQRNIISAVRRQTSKFNINKIKVSVRPEEPEFTPLLKPPTAPSKDNARQLATTAQYIEDEALRKALIKLSKRAE